MAQERTFTVISGDQAGQPGEDQTPDTSAASDLQASDDVGSLAYWQRVAELSPANFAAHTQLGHLHLANGDLEDARAAYRRAQMRKPGHVPSLIGLARVAQRLGEYEEALSHLLPLLAQHPDNADAALTASSLLTECDRLEEAEAVLARAVAKRSTHIGLLTALARLQKEADHRLRALRCWKRILELDPRNVNAMLQAARVLAELRRYPEAERLLRAAREANPGHRAIHVTLANVFYAMGRDAEALASWDAALALDGEAGTGRVNRAGVLIDLGRVDEALGELRTARQNAPENRQIVRLLARASERTERWEAALGHWQSVLSADPGNREAADHVKLCRALLDRDAIIGDQERKFADGTRSRRGLFGRIRGAG